MASNRSIGSLTLDLIARIGGFVTGLDKAEREVKTRSQSMEKSLKNLGTTARTAFAGIGGLSFVRRFISNTVEAENALAQLDAALKSTGGNVGYTSAQLTEMSRRMAAETIHSTAEIGQAQARLLSYTTVVGETYPRALQAAIDQSVRLGISLSQSAEIIGRAIETPSKGIESLSRQGFRFTEAQKDLLKSLENTGRLAESQAIVLGVIEEAYGGAARAARDTFGGALSAVNKSIQDLMTGKDSVPELTKALNVFAETLQDPAFKQAADGVFGGIAKYMTTLTQGAIGWGYRFGLVGDEVIKLDREIEKVQNRISAMERRRAGGAPNWIDWLIQGDSEKKLQGLKKELADLTKQYWDLIDANAALLSSGQGGLVPSAVAPVEVGPSEEFLKLEARLKEQIALYGSVGEAAKIAYQIQSGQLDDLTKAEQQRVLSLARQYDALVANANAEKELEASRKRLEDTLQNQIRAYEQQLALTGEITELDRIRYEIANGGLKGIQADQAAYLESLAKQIDLEKQRADMQDRVNAIIEDTMTPLERYNKTIEELNKLREESIALLGEEGLSYETYARAVAKAQEELEKATHQTNEFMLEAARNTQNILADTLFDAMQGKITDVGKMFKQMVDRMVANAIAADLATKLFGNPESASGGGGWVGAAFNWLGRFFGGGKASGGSVAGGMLYRVNENGVEGLSIPGSGDYLLMGNRSGTVIPNNQVGRRSIVNQNIYVQGRIDQRSARQLELEALRRQRLANARLG